jgi:putative aldouronate transport system permease protein
MPLIIRVRTDDFKNEGAMRVTTKAVQNPAKPMPAGKGGYWHKLGVDLGKNKWLYVMLIPGLIYFLVFKYLPMWGIVIAFEDYSPFLGPFQSPWKGFYWFQRFFSTSKWVTYLSNTLILSLMSIVFTFPAPIILALMLNEIRNMHYKKLTQTLLYMPHFISIVIVVSITYVVFGTDGIMYKLTTQLLGHSIDYLGDPGVFRWMIVGQAIWKETGWGTIIFLAALTNVDTQLYEAAMIDGANRAQRLWHITLPAIRSTIVLLLVLRMGSVLDTGYEHLILMSNALNRSVSQTLDVFVYQQGIQSGQFSYASAIGLMKSVISVTLVLLSNKIAHMLGEQGLY